MTSGADDSGAGDVPDETAEPPERTDLRRGDIIMFGYPRATGPGNVLACLSELVGCLSGTPFTHCAVVVGFTEDSDEGPGEALVAHSTTGLGFVTTPLSLVRDVLGEDVPVAVRSFPADGVDDFVATISDMAPLTPGPVTQRGIYARDRMLYAALMGAARFATFEDEDTRQHVLALAHVGAELLAGDAADDPPRAMCAEFVATGAADSGRPLELDGAVDPDVLLTAHTELGVETPQLQDAFEQYCLDDLVGFIKELAALVIASDDDEKDAGRPGLNAAARALFVRYATDTGAGELAEQLIAASADEEAAAGILETLWRTAQERIDLRALRSFTGDASLFIDVGHLLATPTLGPLRGGVLADYV